ncbi:AP endonuclease [Pseudomonas kribbensis]|uniref:AP endonuclease n=1 Tax=Pseudomonas kribbensis TaxID=1628086 RepID=A0A345RMS7_9PSED|nr:TIM barrel protein [Pseudomonas kribbensis]AXI60593.1 AP endonuclease [Pseudomonas kribbensis]
MGRLIGLAPLSHLELSPMEMVECAAVAGYDCVGLRLIPATDQEPQWDSVGDTALIRDTARRLRDTGIEVSDIELFRLQPTTDLKTFRAALETGALLGARNAVVSGQVADFSQMTDLFGGFCEMAAGYGISANLEPTPWVAVGSVAAAARLIEAADCANAGILIDPIHFDRAGDRVEALAGLPPQYFRLMQLCDAPAQRPVDLNTLLHQARAERLMPGDGGLDLQRLLRAMPRQIPLSLEVPMRSLAAQWPAVERARRMLEKTRALLVSLELDAWGDLDEAPTVCH